MPVAPSVLLEYRLQKQINLFVFTNKSPLLIVPIFLFPPHFFRFCYVFFFHFLYNFIEALHEFRHHRKCQKNLLSMEKLLTNQHTHAHTHTFHSQSIKKTLKKRWGRRRMCGEQRTSRLFTICKNHFWRPIEFCFTVFG